MNAYQTATRRSHTIARRRSNGDDRLIPATRNGVLPKRYASLWRTRAEVHTHNNIFANVKVLALEKDLPGATPSQFTDQLLKEEALRVWQLHQSGVIREVYFRADRDAAVLMLECANLDEARAVLATLPLVQHKLIDFDIIPLTAYAGFARLFEKG